MRVFATADALAEALAEAVAAALAARLARSETAALAVSGGQTPVRFFKTLSAKELDWSRVTVTLVDERWVARDLAALQRGAGAGESAARPGGGSAVRAVGECGGDTASRA